ncbi:MAG: nitrate/sulfonate/bicarbonate ABC transporter ATP-binding protein [Acidobacteriota bacterium]|nr:nitrate/sulfonate/bicarbonate ABC transporter ATP-binding protein [Acidobacteriota bacterium]
MPEAIIQAVKVSKSYGEQDAAAVPVIAPTDLSVFPGQIVALLGPSGCGKSSLLRMLTGLSTPTSGAVLWHGKPVAECAPNVAIVFQSFALFPWLTVSENVEAPLKARGVNAFERRKRSIKILDTVGLDGFEQAYPKELSGGMKQRVGFARALVVEPEVLFMDEPFSALDVLTAENLRSELLELWDKKAIPTKAIFIVTHNIEEAVLLADRIIVLGKHPGRIRTDFEVALPRPRDRKGQEFTNYVDYIYKVLTSPGKAEPEVPLPHEAQQPAAAGAEKPSHYQMLAHARPGGIAGLLELIDEQPNGREDIYRLADELSFELDDLLPIVDASHQLGFLTVEEGDAVITAAGREFVQAGILQRKDLFHDSVLANVTLIKQITKTLEAKRDHSAPEELFHDLLDEHFPEEEASRQMETAISWGRYAELFDYDAARQRLFIPQPEGAVENVAE